MNDRWIDEQVREAFAQVSLPADRVRQLVGPPPRRSRLPALWTALAAAAVVAVVSWPLFGRGPEIEPTPVSHPVSAVPVATSAASPVPVVPAPVPVVPAPVPVVPEPPPPKPPTVGTPELTGLWIGSTAEASSLKMTVLGQTGEDFEGMLELQLDDGFSAVAVTGRVSGDQVILTARDLRFVLTLRSGKLSGHAEIPGKPNLAVWMVGGGILRGGDPGVTPFGRPVPNAAVTPFERPAPKVTVTRGTGKLPSRGPAGHAILQVRANRRVLVYVDDRAVGYAPQDVEVSVGTHRVRVKLPGQPNSEQERQVEVSETTAVTFEI